MVERSSEGSNIRPTSWSGWRSTLALLARVSSYAPLADLTGPALEVERQWLELERLGRPSDHGTWANEVWYAVEIVRAKEDEFIATLQNGWPYLKERNNSRVKSMPRWLPALRWLAIRRRT